MAIQRHQTLPSLSQLAFGPGNAVDRHLPICLSVAWFHRSTAIGKWGTRRWEEMSKRASKQAADNSVFGSYRREGLADLSKVKASWGWLGSGRTPRER